MNFKKPLSSDKQIDHLIENKKVIINSISREAAELYLRGFNYINLITPFKHNYSVKDLNNQPLKISKNNRDVHVYNEETDLTCYLQSFKEEREQYAQIMDGLHKFEITFKSLVTHYLLITFNIDSTQKAVTTFRKFQSQLDHLKIIDYQHEESELKERKTHMSRNYNKIISEFKGEAKNPPYWEGKKVSNIYVYFDRLSLKSVINIFYSLSKNVQNKIYADLKKMECNLETQSLNKFKIRVFNIYPIRNTIMHCNSLEILYRYKTPGSNELRSEENKQQYINTVRALKKLSEKELFNLT
ncbi:hypothetical protein PT184_01810 [Erysipelothrix rhusiopathiae]|nr:hypothetical protein [Erysipelothrix rhusiopathiae]MDE8193612.1 hypothetical protein [Erysipelothrix rhusiopathiae]MDE8204363.1 hypothetical protein [Erysipelothrix rhusiopathiae]MDE8240052.1 hypothetical protein [Erysipelothrix rhusiopathiae]MDE8288447.1 hypothetical protein [Erysipelothrix rhusiopathiae]